MSLADAVRTAIGADPRNIYEMLLLNPLTQKAGSREPVALCPFHSDQHPSFRINLDKAIWYCDVCARGGDVFDLAAALWNSDFSSTVKQLADFLNVNHHNGNGNGAHAHKPDRKVVRRSRYEIRDLEGNLKATHHRVEYDDGSKSMPWEPTGIKPTELPLFQIEKTTDSMDGETVVVCEGEKAAAALWQRRHVAVATVTGADKAGAKIHCDDSLKPLIRFTVALWPDNDDAGHKHMRGHGEALIRLGCQSVRWIDWRDAPPKGDAADFEGDDNALLALIESAQPFNAPATMQEVDDLAVADRIRAQYADEALALGFAQTHGENLRYIAVQYQWRMWDGQSWRNDDTLLAFSLARKICREAANAAADDGVLSENAVAAIASAKKVGAIVQLAKSDRRIAATVEQWDQHDLLLNTPGGVIDLRTGEDQPHRRELFLTKMTAVAPAREANCPKWRAFLDQVTADDSELVEYLRRVAGYALTGLIVEHAVFFLYGTGANGKSVFTNTLLGCLGSYALTSAMDVFVASKLERHPTELADLEGARLVTATETEMGKRWAEARIKALTGGDPIKARRMRQDFFSFAPRFKLLFSGNHKPGLRGVDEATRRRFHLVPFTVTIPEAERDKNLSEKLRAEWPQILRWTIDGCLAWQREGLNPPPVVRAATTEYLNSQDSVETWTIECCVTEPSCVGLTGDLFASWKAWAERTGEFVGSEKNLAEALESRGFQRWRHPASGRRGFRGIGLRATV